MPKYRIHKAAEAVGMTTQLLRAWERRYGLLTPVRSESGYRLYTDEDITYLRAVKALVNEGQSIAEVAQLPREKLLTNERERLRQKNALPLHSPRAFLETTLDAIQTFNQPALESALFRATEMGSFTPVETCDRVLVPLLMELGTRWKRGQLSIAAEHFGSSILRHHLHALLMQETRHMAPGHPIVCAGLEGERHEGGILAFAIHAVAAGWPILYLGLHTPLGEVVNTAEQEQALGIALSITTPFSKTLRASFFAPLTAWKKKTASRFVLVGGKGARLLTKELHAAELTWADQLDMIPRVLEKNGRKKPNETH